MNNASSDIRERRKEAAVNSKEKNALNASMVNPRACRRTISTSQCIFTLFILSLSLFLSTLLLGRLPWGQQVHSTGYIDNLALSIGLQERLYSIVFDAGSTGTRILVFTFHRVRADDSLKLDKEFFEEIKPGLSSYAGSPVKAADSLLPLLEKAKNEIPSENWARTPLVLKATAGLRLLPGDQADSILKEVKKIFKKSPFRMTENSVSIMEGRDEGLFSWFTVNFLLDYLGTENTVATLDLGGGSTQVTFAADISALMDAPKDHLHTVTIFNRLVQIYSHSYLGLGLMSARLAIIQASNNTNPDILEYHTPCVHSNVRSEWKYANRDYTIIGLDLPTVPTPKGAKESKDNPVLRFEECLKYTKQVLSNKVHSPSELSNQQVYAISYYFDRAAEAGLIDPFNGGQISINHYIDAAKLACKNPNSEQPFSCLDLTYISAILNKGLGLNKKPIVVKKKLNGHEISWALGAAFQVLTSPHG